MPTLTEIIRTVKELSFDRFVIGTFTLAARPGETLTVMPKGLTLSKGDEDILKASFEEYPTLEELTTHLLESDVVLSYGGYYVPNDLSNNLVPGKKSLEADTLLNRKNFFSDGFIRELIVDYYRQVLCYGTTPGELDLLVTKLQNGSEKHLCLHVAYQAVAKRRLYELAAEMLGSSFSDGTGALGGGATSPFNTSVQIGSVFSITEDGGSGFVDENFQGVGSDNVLGDKYSFWYRLQCWLRGKVESDYGDYSLREDQVIPGKLILERDLNLRTYYDSYPFTLSPLSRGIL